VVAEIIPHIKVCKIEGYGKELLMISYVYCIYLWRWSLHEVRMMPRWPFRKTELNVPSWYISSSCQMQMSLTHLEEDLFLARQVMSLLKWKMTYNASGRYSAAFRDQYCQGEKLNNPDEVIFPLFLLPFRGTLLLITQSLPPDHPF
jgi:hypothetical protein